MSEDLLASLGPMPSYLTVLGDNVSQFRQRHSAQLPSADNHRPTRSNGDQASAMPPGTVTGRKFTEFRELPALHRHKASPQWVAWKYVHKPGRKKPLKVPVNPATGRAANVSDTSSWGTYEAAAVRARRDDLAGVGIVLVPADGLTGIDLDNCRDPANGALSVLATEVVSFAETYAEVSPSGEGLRLFAEGKVARALKSDKDGIEVYGAGRYLTVTGDHVRGTPDTIGPAPKTLALLERVRAALGVEAPESGTAARGAGLAWPDTAESVASLDGMLAVLDPDQHRPSWLPLIFAMAATGLPCAKAKARDWSARSARFDEGDFDKLWDSYDPHHLPAVGVGTLVHHAKQAGFTGFVPVQVDAGSLGAQASAASAPVSIRCFPASDLAERAVPARPWLVRDVVPDHTVTLLNGDGGTGKSLLALQLAVAVATGTDWFGTKLEAGSALYLSAEDDEDEVHRRLADIIAAEGASFAELERLHVVPLAGMAAVLAAPEGRSEIIVATPLWAAIEAEVAKLRPRLVVVDNLADAFAGNENSRPQARQFVGLLRGLALRHGLAVVLLGHPSLTGMSSGTGTSGSTAWSNSVRSRLYLDRVKAEDGTEPDPNLRVLRVMKANYTAIGAEVRMRWEAGRFKVDGTSIGAFDRMAAGQHAERVFLELLRLRNEQGRGVSPNKGSTYAPAVFAAHPDAAGITAKAFAVAMERLFAAGKIATEMTGPASKKRERIKFSN